MNKCIKAFMWTAVIAFTQSNTQAVIIERVTEGALKEARAVYKNALAAAYKGISLEDLAIKSTLNDFADAAFDEEVRDLNAPNTQVYCMVARDDSQPGNPVGGVIFFEPTTQKGKVYVRQLAVDPTLHRKGYGSCLMNTILETLPDTELLSLATRRVNKMALAFYGKHKFTLTPDTPHGLNPERYVGLQKRIR